jgi:hypothetical protein
VAATVLDSYALLTSLRDEPGADLVRRLMEKEAEEHVPLHMTEVNDAEVQ